MDINFNTLLKLILPTSLRNGLTELVKAVASQFTALYSDFQAWQADIRLQAEMTCQVMYLEAILNYRLLGNFLRTIYITDGDGVLVDFIVNVPEGVSVDSNRLVALLEKYKTYGKRYQIEQSQYTYNVNWGGFVCEQIAETFVTEWGGFVCEREAVPTNLFTFSTINNNTTVLLTTQHPVGVEVTVLLSVKYNTGVQQEGIYIVVPSGASGGSVTVGGQITDVFVRSITPSSDANYDFIY